MYQILVKAGIFALVCVCFKLAVSVIAMPLLGARLDPYNWFVFAISPALVAMPAATYFYWRDSRLRHNLISLKRAHVDLGRAHRRLGEEARRDSMTGLLNRESFVAALEKARSRKDDGTLLIADADHFKTINDTYGHMAGDAALCEIASALRKAIRGRDIAGRIGGEEFGIYLAGVGGAEAEVIAERIRRAVEAIPFSPAPDTTAHLTVSIGGVSAENLATADELMRLADKRLYEAKRAGRNKAVLVHGAHTPVAA